MKRGAFTRENRETSRRGNLLTPIMELQMVNLTLDNDRVPSYISNRTILCPPRLSVQYPTTLPMIAVTISWL